MSGYKRPGKVSLPNMTAAQLLLSHSIQIVLHQAKERIWPSFTPITPTSVVQRRFQLFEAGLTSYNLTIRLSGEKARSHFFV